MASYIKTNENGDKELVEFTSLVEKPITFKFKQVAVEAGKKDDTSFNRNNSNK